MIRERTPFITDMHRMFTCCLYCKKGRISCSKRCTIFNTIKHTECKKAFSTYEHLYEDMTPPSLSLMKEWKEVKKERAKSTVVETAVESPEPVISTVSIVTPCVTPSLSTDTEAKIVSMWKARRDPDDDVESDEETMEGKLLVLLNTLVRTERSNDRLRETLSNNTALDEMRKKYNSELSKVYELECHIKELEARVG